VYQPKALAFPPRGDGKIRIPHHRLFYSAAQQIICNGIFHPYRKPKGAKKIFVGSIKQRIGSELHIVSLTLVAKSMVVPLEVLYLMFDKKSSTPEKSGKKVKIPHLRAGFFREEAHKRCVSGGGAKAHDLTLPPDRQIGIYLTAFMI
jgi:hypothetical protein